MKNRQNTIWNKKIPAFFGIAAFFVGALTLGWLSTNAILFGTKASIGSVPKQIQITNITPTSFTVTFITDEQALGSIAYGSEAKMGQVAFDDRDSQTGKPAAYYVHSVTAKPLSPGTKYFFAIASGDNTALDNNQPFQVTTASLVATGSANQSLLTGKVTLNDGTIPTEGIVSVSSDASQVVSALLSPDGSYTIPLTNLLTSNLTSPVSLTPNTTMHLTATNGKFTSTVSLLGNQTNPVPLIILNNNYDFTISNNPISSTTNATNSAQPGFSVPKDTSQVSSPVILAPKPQEKLQDQQPMFSGKAIAHAAVQIVIESAAQIQTTIQADSYGNWQFRPPISLGAGQHTITISSPDINGFLQTVTQTFTVYAAGSQFIEPSVSPIPTATPAATPLILPTPTATPPAMLPTLTPTPLTPSPTLSITPIATVTQPIPNTGSSSLVLGVAGALSAISIGTFLFIFTLL